MTTRYPALTFVGAKTLIEGQMSDSPVSVADGRLADAHLPSVDASGYLLLPGIIDLHGDAFERHITPRPTAPFPIRDGLIATDRDAASNGVTTAWLAQSWSWEGGVRGPDYAEELLAEHQKLKPILMTDLRVQIRCETHTVDTQDRLIAAVHRYGVDYVVFNNHLPEALALADKNPQAVAAWASKAKRTVQEHLDLVQASMARAAEVPRYLCNLASAFDRHGVTYGSHDDSDGATRERFSMIGAKVCEFPTSIGAALVARTWQDPILMGAPNVVRGGSQSGNVSATELVDQNCCDALVSDYTYPALATAAFTLSDNGHLSFADAWAMVSSNPARILKLADRGSISPSKRADLTIIRADNRQIEGTMVGGRWSHLCGELAERVMSRGETINVAAE